MVSVFTFVTLILFVAITDGTKRTLFKLELPTIEEQRFWTVADLKASISVPSYEQMRPFINRLEAGNPVTVLVLGSSISRDYAGCLHRDRFVIFLCVRLCPPLHQHFSCGLTAFTYDDAFSHVPVPAPSTTQISI